MKLKIKKGSTVQVIAGSNKGHKGEVLAVDSQRLRIKVTGHNMQTHFDRENSTITQKEGFVDYSNVKLATAAKKAKAKKKTTKKASAKK